LAKGVAPATFGKGLETYQVFDFKKGLNIKDSPLQLAVQKGQNTLRKADNCVYTASGAVTKRFDIERMTTSSVGASVAITGGSEFVKSDGTRFNTFGGDDGKVYRLNSDGTTATFHTGATTGTRWYFAVYNDKLIFCNRADAPRKTTDAATSAVLGGTPPAKGGPVVVHSNRVFFADASAGLKSTIAWSALNSEEDYTTALNAGSAVINQNDGSDIVDLVPSINELIIFKGGRPYRLQGTSPSTYSITNVVPTTGSKGAVSTKGNVFAINDVWFLANNGILNLRTVLNFGDLKASYASDRIAPYWEAGSGVTLGLQNLANAVMVYDSQNNRIYCAASTGATTKNDIVLVIDLHTNGWSVWPDVALASMWPVFNTTTGVTDIFAGGYNGHVYKLNQDISVNAFRGEARHLSALNAPGIQKSPRHGFFYFKEEGDFAVIIDTKFDFGASGGQSYTASLLGGSHTLGVNWQLGVDPLGRKDQLAKRIDMAGLGEFLEIGIKNVNAGEPFTWYGYEILWRPRRAVRPSTTGGTSGGAGFGAGGFGI
jgi:hypothetical protein